MLNLKDTLDSFGYDVTEDAKKNLQRKKKNASKSLSNSLDYKLKVSAKKDKFTLSFFMEEYGEYIDRGVKGAGGTKADEANGRRSAYLTNQYGNKEEVIQVRNHQLKHLISGL